MRVHLELPREPLFNGRPRGARPTSHRRGQAAPWSRMTTGMELVEPLEPNGEESALARARLHRQLTVEETARRAGISVEQVRWLEEGRVYRFPTPDDALVATLLYATALG